MIIKYWHSVPIQKQAVQKRYLLETPQTYINREIRTVSERIPGYFANEAAQLLIDIRKVVSETGQSNAPRFQDVVQSHVDKLWMNCAKDYAVLSMFTYLDSIQGKADDRMKKSTESKKLETALVDEVCVMAQRAITNYYKQKTLFAEAVLSAITGAEDFGEIKEPMIATFKRGGNRLVDVAHEIRIQSTLDWLRIVGCDQYTYICSSGDNSCDTCMSLDGQNFAIKKAVVGVNLPPMHPNCRCTIEAYPALSDTDFVSNLSKKWIDELERQMKDRLNKLEIAADFVLSEVYVLWLLFFLQAVKDYCGAYSTYEIDGTEYNIRLDSFEGVAYLPDGTFIKPENLKPLDKKMLELMKKRDSLKDKSPEKIIIEQQIEALVIENKAHEEEHNEKILSVSRNKPYTFYAFGGDITQQLYSYMKQAETDYAHMHDRMWAENLLEFRDIVGNKDKMDLKNQPEWQHSAYVFNGEIVDQDALGNINYGYFGKYCNIPDVVLFLGAGYAQIVGSNRSAAFWFTFMDDPRDNDRVMQGIDIYNDLH